MAYDGILRCFNKDERWFLGVVVTDGSGSSRNGLYANYSNDEMKRKRKLEQKKAAFIGEYGAVIQLDYKSSEVKEPKNSNLVEELKELIIDAKPEIIYTHNLADKHDTHVAVSIKVLQALRGLPDQFYPKKIYGCEVWRGLDWLSDDDKVIFDVASHPNLANALIEIYDSQICGGKRYDKATIGRRLANATYAESHKIDLTTAIIYAMDFTPLINDIHLDISEYVQGYIRRFGNDVINRIKNFSM